MIINAYTPNTEIFNNLKTIDNNKESETSFANVLKTTLNDINNKQIEADNLTQNFIEGGDTDIHEVMIASEEANLSLQLAVQIRNKILDGIQQITNLQL